MYSAVDLPRCGDWGTHACAIRASDQGIDCWGSDTWHKNEAPEGQWLSLSVGEDDGCALGLDGRIACWGRYRGGDVVYTQADDYVDVSNCDNGICGLASDGRIDCWESGYEANLRSDPGPWTDMQASDISLWCALDHDGIPYCALGAIDLPNTKGSVDLCLPDNDIGSCMLSSDGHVECTGVVSGPPASSFSSIACGQAHACGVTTDGGIECWGEGCETMGRCDVPEHE